MHSPQEKFSWGRGMGMGDSIACFIYTVDT
jgi:hypothetical protein